MLTFTLSKNDRLLLKAVLRRYIEASGAAGHAILDDFGYEYPYVIEEFKSCAKELEDAGLVYIANSNRTRYDPTPLVDLAVEQGLLDDTTDTEETP